MLHALVISLCVGVEQYACVDEGNMYILLGSRMLRYQMRLDISAYPASKLAVERPSTVHRRPRDTLFADPQVCGTFHRVQAEWSTKSLGIDWVTRSAEKAVPLQWNWLNTCTGIRAAGVGRGPNECGERIHAAKGMLGYVLRPTSLARGLRIRNSKMRRSRYDCILANCDVFIGDLAREADEMLGRTCGSKDHRTL
jgi:hypothetical protein